jgi:hypothetical protein
MAAPFDRRARAAGRTVVGEVEVDEHGDVLQEAGEDGDAAAAEHEAAAREDARAEAGR